MEVCEADIRCLDAHAHFGNFVFDRTAEAIRHYKAGVRMWRTVIWAELRGLLPWVTSRSSGTVPLYKRLNADDDISCRG